MAAEWERVAKKSLVSQFWCARTCTNFRGRCHEILVFRLPKTKDPLQLVGLWRSGSLNKFAFDAVIWPEFRCISVQTLLSPQSIESFYLHVHCFLKKSEPYRTHLYDFFLIDYNSPASRSVAHSPLNLPSPTRAASRLSLKPYWCYDHLQFVIVRNLYSLSTQVFKTVEVPYIPKCVCWRSLNI